MLRLNVLLAGLLLSIAGCSSGVYVGSTGSPAPPVRASAPAVRATATASITISTEQAAAIRAYYGEAPQSNAGRGRGRGRSGGLPPGIARNLERGKPLPPGIAKQYLPHELLVRLPGPGAGLEYAVVAGKLLLVEVATQLVREVLLETVFG